MYVKDIYSNDDELHKAWVALTTCTTTRSIYLDIVSDCSGPTCVNLLKRFTATHGQPKIVISDNGTSFVSSEVQNFMSNRGTLWKFNIEKAPWYGGFFERLVRSVKRCLRKILQNAKLNYEEMRTTLKEVENILNNRPITYVYTDEFIEPLTPNKLVYGRDLNYTVLDNITEESELDLNDRYVYIKQLIDHFWNRWYNEYLVSLREQTCKYNQNMISEPNVGDIALIHDDKLKRQQWRIGKSNKNYFQF